MGKIMWVISTHRSLPPFSNFLHRNVWFLCADAVILWTALKLLSPDALFSVWNVLNVVWRPSSTQTWWGEGQLKFSPKLLSCGQGISGNKGRERKGRKGRGSWALTEIFKSWRLWHVHYRSQQITGPHICVNIASPLYCCHNIAVTHNNYPYYFFLHVHHFVVVLSTKSHCLCDFIWLWVYVYFGIAVTADVQRSSFTV